MRNFSKNEGENRIVEPKVEDSSLFGVIDIADRAGVRLRKRYNRLVYRGKPPCKAVVAVTRELARFIWSVLIEYEIRENRKTA